MREPEKSWRKHTKLTRGLPAGTQCQTEFCWQCLQPINHGGQYCGCNQNRFQGAHLQGEAPGAVAAPVAGGQGRIVWAPRPRAQLTPEAAWAQHEDLFDD